MPGPGAPPHDEPRASGAPWTNGRPGWPDLACAALLALACVLLRAGSLHHVSLNPDESQYQATASYLAATEQSPLSYDLGSPATYAIFTLAHRVFGPYSIFEVRLLVQAICAILAWSLFWIVRAETNRWCGLAAGMVFLHYSMLCEGLSVNSEWFAVSMTALGLCLWLAARDRAGPAAQGVRLLAGLSTGLALWFKVHALFTVLAVPLAISYLAFERRDLRQGAQRLGAFAAGGVLAGAVHFAPYYLAGNLGLFLGDVLSDWRIYVRGNEEVVRAASRGPLEVLARGLFLDLPHRPLLLAAYVFAALAAVQATLYAVRRRPPRPFAARPAIVACVAWLVTAMGSVQLGHRFFTHYYLMMIPPLAALVGFALHWLWREAPRHKGTVLGALYFFLALAFDAWLELRAVAPRDLRPDARTILFLLYAAGTLALLGWLILRPLERAPRVAAAGLALHVLLLIGLQQITPTPRSMSHNPYSFDALAAWLRGAARPGDRLFVWGWAPEIYPLAGLEAASRIVTSEYVVRDFLAVWDRPSLDPAWTERLMRDLRERKPRFIVDASARSWTSTDARFYRLDLYPEFELVQLLSERYVARATIDGCVIYERVPGEDKLTPQSAL